MNEILQTVNAIFQQRGYLVMGTHTEYAAGDVVNSVIAWGDEVIYHKLVVLSPTDENDFIEQWRLAGYTEPNPATGGWANYYRVTCE